MQDRADFRLVHSGGLRVRQVALDALQDAIAVDEQGSRASALRWDTSGP
jgi:hypothetical protein